MGAPPPNGEAALPHSPVTRRSARRSRLVRRPELLGVVVRRERRNRVRKRDPAQLRSCVDVDVGSDARRIVERSAPNEPDARSRVLAVDRDLTRRAPEDSLLLARAARHVHRQRVTREQLDSVGLDQQVDHESASGLPLAVQAVAAMREERIGCKAVANRPARAATLTKITHELLLEDKALEPAQYPWLPLALHRLAVHQCSSRQDHNHVLRYWSW